MPVHIKTSSDLWKGEETTFVIVPFGVIPLGKHFRAWGKDWQKSSSFHSCEFAYVLPAKKVLLRINEERLVVTLDSYVDSELRKYIVQVIRD